MRARHAKGRRTARENLDDLLDPGSFVEYGPLIYAAQERRRPRQELIERTPADGLVGGTGTIGGRPVLALSYDYTVLAGTQGWRNHAKKDRLFELAYERGLPVVLFAEGGGGRPGDVDMPVIAGLDTRAFELFARLSGDVPLVGIATGFTFAGNAGAARVLRRGDRDRGGVHRDGRPGNDRGWRPRPLLPRGGRADRTCSGTTASSTCASPTTAPRSPQRGPISDTSRTLRPSAHSHPPTRPACATSSPPTASASTRSAP